VAPFPPSPFSLLPFSLSPYSFFLLPSSFSLLPYFFFFSSSSSPSSSVPLPLDPTATVPAVAAVERSKRMPVEVPEVCEGEGGGGYGKRSGL
jgi:hypothetical protein